MNSNELREKFLSFFESKEHLRLPSSSLIPSGDPTLLLTTAGMVQIKPYFLGEAMPPANRLTSSQKCFRMTDIDTIGDHKHLTFFEMLGNFSVGNYFKENAIEFAWEFLTSEIGLQPDKLWVTVFLEDEEAFLLWRDKINIPIERIYRYGKNDNWWGPPGLEGPCGPCSEIHYDFGEQLGCSAIAPPEKIISWEQMKETTPSQQKQPGCHPNCDNCERFIELWNLVFMGFFQNKNKELSPLPSPNIDTGMGLERASVIVQGVRNVYETDLFKPIIGKVSLLTGKQYGENDRTDKGIRVVSEHTRGAVFLIADGVIPGNDERGYVLKHLIRRAAFYSRELLNRASHHSPLLSQVADTVINEFANTYGELRINREHILEVIGNEEERFYSTLDRGVQIIEELADAIETLSQKIELGKSIDFPDLLDEFDEPGVLPESITEAYLNSLRQANPATSLSEPLSEITKDDLLKTILSIPGNVVFLLYDTYGFPPELTEEIGIELGLVSKLDEFSEEMELQQARSRSVSSKYKGPSTAKIFKYDAIKITESKFIGYDQYSGKSTILGLFFNDLPTDHVKSGQQAEIVLRETPFYPEGGGQIGDTGIINGPKGSIEVTDTQSPLAGLIIHKGTISNGTLSLGDIVQANVNRTERQRLASNHTGTHLLHAALRRVLGPHVHQAGSLVTPDRIRFDFTHTKALTRDEREQIERLVNEQVRSNSLIETREIGLSEAIQEGALSFFGDKYGAKVRVVGIADHSENTTQSSNYFSKEMCGGTHLQRTGELGLFLILSENSIGAGMRRIEAISGNAAESTARENLYTLASLNETLDTTGEGIHEKIQSILKDIDAERKKNDSLERSIALREAEGLLNKAITSNGFLLLSTIVNANSAESLREVGDYLRDKIQNGIIILGSLIKDRPILVVMVTPEQVSKGYNAKEIIQTGSEIIGGGGGGRPEIAQAGGQHKERLSEALKFMCRLVQN